MGKKLTIIGVVLYIIIAHIFAKFGDIHWIHFFNSFMLVSILHNILEWKYDWVEESEEENNADETINNE